MSIRLLRTAGVTFTAGVTLTVGVAFAAAVSARPLAAGDGQGGVPPASQSQVAPAAPTARGSFTPLRADPPGPRARGPATPVAAHPAWRWPLQPRPALLRGFTAPPSPYGRGHRGLDLGSRAGSEVLSVAPGTVTHAGVVAGRGTVTVAHPEGLSSTYEPVAAVVREGTLVAVGDVLGVVESARAGNHCGALSCVHLGARREAVYVDPLPLLLGGRAVLLPLSLVPDQALMAGP